MSHWSESHEARRLSSKKNKNLVVLPEEVGTICSISSHILLVKDSPSSQTPVSWLVGGHMTHINPLCVFGWLNYKVQLVLVEPVPGFFFFLQEDHVTAESHRVARP